MSEAEDVKKHSPAFGGVTKPNSTGGLFELLICWVHLLCCYKPTAAAKTVFLVTVIKFLVSVSQFLSSCLSLMTSVGPELSSYIHVIII